MADIFNDTELQDIHLELDTDRFGDDYDLCFVALVDDMFEYEEIDHEHMNKCNMLIDRLNCIFDGSIISCEVSEVDILLFNADTYKFERVNRISGTDEYMNRHRSVQLRIYIKGRMKPSDYNRFMKCAMSTIEQISWYTDIVLCDYDDKHEDTYRDFFGNYEIFEFITFEQCTIQEYKNNPDKYKFKEILVDGKRGIEVKSGSKMKRV